MIKLISYIGSKVKLFDFLNENMIEPHKKNYKVFYDLFAGTNSVSHYILKNTNWDIITNDIMPFSYTLSFILNKYNLSQNELNKLKDILMNLYEEPLIKGDIFNEFSINGTPKTIDKNIFNEIFKNQPYKHSRMFFSEIVGKRIDTVKNKIKELFLNNTINEIEKNILLSVLLNYVNRNGNTTSIFSAYLKNINKIKKEKPFLTKEILNMFNYSFKDNNIKHYNMNTKELLDKLDFKYKDNNIIYIDPPYNTRSYEANYFLLNYIIDFNFDPLNDIKYNSKTGLCNIKNNNSFRKKNEIINEFKEIISKSLLLSNHIYISYSTDGLINQSNIEDIYNLMVLKYPNLKLKTYKQKYKRFKSNNKLKDYKKEYEELLKKVPLYTKDYIKLNKLEDYIMKEENKKRESLYEILWYFKK